MDTSATLGKQTNRGLLKDSADYDGDALDLSALTLSDRVATASAPEADSDPLVATGSALKDDFEYLRSLCCSREPFTPAEELTAACYARLLKIDKLIEFLGGPVDLVAQSLLAKYASTGVSAPQIMERNITYLEATRDLLRNLETARRMFPRDDGEVLVRSYLRERDSRNVSSCGGDQFVFGQAELISAYLDYVAARNRKSVKATAADEGQDAYRLLVRIVAQSGKEDELVTRNTRLALSLAKKYRTTRFPIIDAFQAATVGLAQASERFCPERGCRFSTYATWWIKQALQKAATSGNNIVSVPGQVRADARAIRNLERSRSSDDTPLTVDHYAKELNLDPARIRLALQSRDTAVISSEATEHDERGLDRFVTTSRSADPLEQIIRQERIDTIRRVAHQECTELEISVLRLSGYISSADGSVSHLSPKQIAATLGVSAAKVPPLLRLAFRKIGLAIGNLGINLTER